MGSKGLAAGSRSGFAGSLAALFTIVIWGDRKSTRLNSSHIH